jgi:hypothetical protein
MGRSPWLSSGRNVVAGMLCFDEPAGHVIGKVCALAICIECIVRIWNCTPPASHARPQVHGWFQTTDSGPDECYCAKIIGTECLDLARVLHLRTPCYKHQGHLGIRGGFEELDELLQDTSIEWKYFSTLAEGHESNEPQCCLQS